MLRGLVDSILEPGINSQLLVAMNVTFVVLLLLLAVMAYASGFDILLIGLFGIALLLFISVSWFVHELSQTKQADREKTERTKQE